jgi:hypothetical protein
MTKALRSIVLAAVTAFVVGALPGAALAVPCDDSKDCAPGSRCDKPDPTKPGVCVGASGGTESAASPPCETSKDCPEGSRCTHKYKGKPGVCVAKPKAKPKGQAVHKLPCEDSQDCPVGGRCDHKPGKTGFCVGGSKK